MGKRKIEKAIEDIGKEIGLPQDAIDNVLFGSGIDGYKRGRKLTNREVSQLKVGDIVWLRYREDGGWRIDDAEEIYEIDDSHIAFGDADFKFPAVIDDNEYGDFEYGEGYIFEAIKNAS